MFDALFGAGDCCLDALFCYGAAGIAWGGDVEDDSDVGSDCFLEAYDFCGVNFYATVGEYLVGAGVGHYCSVEAEEFVYAFACGGEFGVFGDEVGVCDDLLVADAGDCLDWN